MGWTMRGKWDREKLFYFSNSLSVNSNEYLCAILIILLS